MNMPHRYSATIGRYRLYIDQRVDMSMFSTGFYGYALNISHPMVADRYRRFIRRRGIPGQYPLSDAEREEFEKEVLQECGIQFERLERYIEKRLTPTLRK